MKYIIKIKEIPTGYAMAFIQGDKILLVEDRSALKELSSFKKKCKKLFCEKGDVIEIC